MWLAEIYPDERVVINSNVFVAIRLPKREVIYDEKDGVWIFAIKKRKEICYVSDFISVITYMYHDGCVTRTGGGVE